MSGSTILTEFPTTKEKTVGLENETGDVPCELVDSISKSNDTVLAARFLFGSTPRSLAETTKFWNSPSYIILEQLVSRDPSTYLQWARELGYAGAVPSGSDSEKIKAIIDEWVGSIVERVDDLWNSHVPNSGPVKSVQGELLYAIKNIEHACNSEDNGFDDYLNGLKDFIYSKIVKSKLPYLVQKVFINDVSELTSSLPGSGSKQSCEYFESLIPTKYSTRLTRLRVVVLSWILAHEKPMKYSGEVEQEFRISSSPQEIYRPKLRKAKMPRLDEYALWAVDLGLQKESFKGLAKKSEVHSHVDEWILKLSLEKKQLWKELVPESGVASTLQGELIRAEGRLSSELFRNGMMNWDVYYEGLLRLMGVTLGSYSGFSERVMKGLSADIAEVERAGKMGEAAARGEQARFEVLGESFFMESDAEKALNRLSALIAIWVQNHPEPIPYKPRG
jgi:hypothetical protein